MNANEVIGLLTSKNFKRVAYKKNPEKRRPCFYCNIDKAKRVGKRTTRLLVYMGDDDVWICWETKDWPETYKSKGEKLALEGLTEEKLLAVMRDKFRDMLNRHREVELKDRRRPAANAAEVEAAAKKLADPKPQPKPAQQPQLRLVASGGRKVPQTSAGMANTLSRSLEALQEATPKKPRKGPKPPEGQTAFDFK